eukprot:scaffold10270_cov417-Chaetoceros_neogracile.AAC.10
MDYIVDLSNPDETCRHLLLHYMRIESELDNSNSAHSNYTADFRRSDIAALNELDMQCSDKNKIDVHEKGASLHPNLLSWDGGKDTSGL